MKNSQTRPFTLLEIVICMAILGIASVGIGWQMKNMIGEYRFQKSIDAFLTDLRKSQVIALSDRIDVQVQITKKNGQYQYSQHADDPAPYFISKPVRLTGVKEIKQKDKHLDTCVLKIYSSGRIEPKTVLTFVQKRGKELEMDVSSPLNFPKKLQPSD